MTSRMVGVLLVAMGLTALRFSSGTIIETVVSVSCIILGLLISATG